MKRIGTALLLVGLCGMLPARAAKNPQIPFEKYTLANGLEVILHVDHRLPLVATNVWYHVAAKDEPKGRSGFAHLFEHLMFQASAHVPPDQFFTILESIGASDINGSTEWDRTNYFETVPSNHLETLLWMESDRMGFLLDTMTQGMLDNQRDVVRNERRQTTENRPYGKGDERMYQLLFPDPHPYHGVVIGSHADLEAATLEDVKGFFRTYYAPNNATLVVAGDFDPAAAKPLIEKYFGPIEKGAEPPPPPAGIQPPPEKELRETLTDNVQLPRITFAWVAGPRYGKEEADFIILAQLLGGSKSSRLYKKLVLDQKIAQSVTCVNEGALLGSIFQCELLGKPGTDPAAMEKVLDAELADLRAKGPNAAELARAKAARRSGLLHALENIGRRADILNEYNLFAGDPGYLGKDLARTDAVTVASAKAMAVKWLDPAHRVVITVLPKGGK